MSAYSTLLVVCNMVIEHDKVFQTMLDKRLEGGRSSCVAFKLHTAQELKSSGQPATTLYNFDQQKLFVSTLFCLYDPSAQKQKQRKSSKT